MPYYWQNAMLLNAEHFRDTMHGAYMAECRISFAKMSHSAQLQRAGARGLPSHSVPFRSSGSACFPVLCRQSKSWQVLARSSNGFRSYRTSALCACLCQRCDISPLTDEAVSSAVARRLPLFWPQVVACNSRSSSKPPLSRRCPARLECNSWWHVLSTSLCVCTVVSHAPRVVA